jgi:hypothetical protein
MSGHIFIDSLHPHTRRTAPACSLPPPSLPLSQISRELLHGGDLLLEPTLVPHLLPLSPPAVMAGFSGAGEVSLPLLLLLFLLDLLLRVLTSSSSNLLEPRRP